MSLAFFDAMREQILENIKEWRSTVFLSKPKPLPLGAIRDLLLPCLYGERGQHPELDFDIKIDRTTSSLLITGRNTKTNKYLGFAITRGEIENKRYMKSFMPSLRNLSKLLLDPSTV